MRSGPPTRCTHRRSPAAGSTCMGIIDDHSRLLVDYQCIYHDDAARFLILFRHAIATPRHPVDPVCRQRLPVHRRGAATHVRPAGDPGHPFRPGPPRRPRKSRTSVQDGAGAVPGRGPQRRGQLRSDTTWPIWPRCRRHCGHGWLGSITGASTRRPGRPREQRWAEGDPPAYCPTPEQLRQAFAWTVTRTVSKTATVSLEGNRYTVDDAFWPPQGHRTALRPVRSHQDRDLLGSDGWSARPCPSTSAAMPIRRRRPKSGTNRSSLTGIDYIATALPHAHQAETAGRLHLAHLVDPTRARHRQRHRAGPRASSTADRR